MPSIAPLAVMVAILASPPAEPASPATGEPVETASQPTPHPTDEQINLALDRAIEFLWTQQRRDGRWVSSEFEKTFPNGLTALVAYTMRAAGVPLSDHRLQRAVRHLLETREETKTVYAKSFSLMLWCTLSRTHFKQQIKDDVRFLKLQQNNSGGWGYGTLSGVAPGKNWTDNSNSQLALLALHKAAQAGADVPGNVWRRAEQSWLESVNPDGGWGYPLSDDPEFANHSRHSTGSMTAAGLASLQIVYEHRHLDAELPFTGKFKAKCGEDIEETRPIRQAIEHAWEWLDENFRTDRNPGYATGESADPNDGYLTYYLFCLDRAGVSYGRKRIGSHVWYNDVTAQLVSTQKMDGSWGAVHDTCFGILALLKMRAPVLINKLKQGAGNDWNRDPREAANLLHWFGERFETNLTWQVVELGPDTSDVYDAPVLLVSGHNAPQLSPEQQQRLREYVHDGGTVLAVACCSQAEFRDGWRDLFKDLFPTFTSGTLAKDHPVWTIHDDLRPGKECIGFGDGYRTSIFILDNAACCAWHQNLVKKEARRFSLAGNILLYAMFNKSLDGRLSPYLELHEARPMRTLTIARLAHGGDWFVHPRALHRISAVLSGSAGLSLAEIGSVRVEHLDNAPAKTLWLTGHDFPSPSSVGGATLKRFLESGGTLIASASRGSDEFDESFQLFIEDSFGEDAWQRIGPEDPLMTGSFAPHLASSLHATAYRQRYREGPPVRLDWPELAGVRQGDRWAVIYSPYDLSAGISHHTCLDCIGYEPRSAEAIVANIMLYVASRTPDTAQAPGRPPSPP